MKKIISTVMAVVLSMGSISALAEGSFIYSPWAEDECKTAVEKAWIPENVFDLTKTITREEFCITVYNALKEVNADIDRFFDAPPFGDTSTYEVNCLYTEGIIEGKGEKIFAPDDYLTREEAAVIFSRICKFLEIGTDIDSEILYTDHDEISDWAKDDVYKINNLRIMKGTDKGFEPKGNITFEQAAVCLVRILDLYNNSTFADSMNALMPKDKNYMFSPLSVKMAFALAANGADDETKEEILNALCIDDLDSFNDYSRDIISLYGKSERIDLNIANSVWVNKSFGKGDFNPNFKNKAATFYNAETGAVNKDNAHEIINKWVADKTNNKIEKIIDEDTLFYTAIINAIYFKGEWMNDFVEELTMPDVFTDADNNKTEIDFMNQTDYFNYCKTENCTIVELPYKRDIVNNPVTGEETNLNLSMFVLMGDDFDVEKELQKADTERCRIKLSMPKFKIEFSTQLNDILTAMGIKKAFEGGFPYMIDNEMLFIDQVLHKTYINVDEKGTEAAAVTGILAGATAAMPQKPIEVKIDKPFYFAICDKESSEILFIGRYAYAK